MYAIININTKKNQDNQEQLGKPKQKKKKI